MLLRGLGTDVRVSLNALHPDIAAQLRGPWVRCLTDTDDADDNVPVVSIPVSPDLAQLDDSVLQRLTQDVTLALIKRRIGELLMFHAAGLAHPETGRSLVLVASATTGKTTMSTVLGRQLGYLTDETVGILPDGTICPYPKPLSRRMVPGEAKVETSPDDLGLLPAPPHPTVGAIVLLKRDPEVARPRLDRLPLIESIPELAPQTSSLSALDRPLQRLAAMDAELGGIWRCTYAEATEAAPLLRELIGA